MWVTIILFCVNVPVLSEQITVAQPKVSTDGSLRTMACRLIIRCTPRANAIVTIAGNPSGMAATAKETPAKEHLIHIMPVNDSGHDHHRGQNEGHNNQHFSQLLQPALQRSVPPLRPFRLNRRFFPSRGHARGNDNACSTSPHGHGPHISHVFPVADGHIRRKSASLCFFTGTDSPVRADSSTYKLSVWIQRTSAGIRSPLSTDTISPGTSREASIFFHSPSRLTLAAGTDNFFNACRDFSARIS